MASVISKSLCVLGFLVFLLWKPTSDSMEAFAHLLRISSSFFLAAIAVKVAFKK